MRPKIKIGSVYEVEHWRKSSFRSGAFYEVDHSWDHNVVTDEGLNKLLDVMFHGVTAIGTWYVAIYNDDVTPGTGDTYAVPTFTESSNYSEANRVAFNEAAASRQSITNGANKASFTMSTSETVYGAALVSNNSKGDTAATGAVLFGAAKFSSSKTVASDDVLKVTVTISASSS
jgi:hypothetical protein